MIRAIDDATFSLVLLAGGEPSLDPELIRTGIDVCSEREGLSCAIVTAPIWAQTAEKAETFISRLKGLTFLILSYDDYHLRFLSRENYRFATRAANDANLPVIVQIAYGAEHDLERLTNEATALGKIAHVNGMRIVEVGNATTLVELRRHQVRTPADLEALPKTCVAGNAFVDSAFRVHLCCWASACSSSPLSVQGHERSLHDAFADLEKSRAARTLIAEGFVGSLTGLQRKEVLRLASGKKVATECDLCLIAMRDAPRAFWRSIGE